MRRIFPILTIMLILTCFSGSGQNRSIQFIEKPWSEILSMAATENKLIFLDAYTSWCGPCKWMASKMFTNDTIADFYNSNFICAHVDMEKGEGPELAKIYKVRAYPTLLFLAGSGELIHLRVGAPPKVQDYIDMGQVALTPGAGFGATIKEYQAGNRDPYFMMKFFDQLQGAYIPINEPLNQFFASQNEEDLLSRTNWEIIYRYVYDLDSREFGYLLKNQKEFEKRYTRDSVYSKISTVYAQTLNSNSRYRSFDEAKYNAVREKIKNSGFEGAELVIFTADLNVHQLKGENEKYIALSKSGVDKYYKDDYGLLNGVAWTFFQIASDKKDLEMASGWAKKSIALKSTPENNDTYANLAFKMGNKSEAVKYEKRALELAKKAGIPINTYEDTLKKFQE